MALAIGLYLLVGATLGWSWNRAELGRAGPRRWGPSFGLCVVAWPLLVVLAIALAGVSVRLDKRRHDPAPRAAPPPASGPDAAPMSVLAGGPTPSHPT